MSLKKTILILRAALETIDSYSDTWIHVYTDGSAFRGTSKAGYGVLIHYPDGSSGKFSGACGEHASNYIAEIAAIETSLHYINTFFETFPARKQNIVIFTDSKSALDGLNNDPTNNEDFKKILLETHELIETMALRLPCNGSQDTPTYLEMTSQTLSQNRDLGKNNHPHRQHMKQSNRSYALISKRNG